MTPKTPTCPRCDYDLSGEVANWTAECPLHGRCPECGLDFAWSVLWREEPAPRWSFEHATESSGGRFLAMARGWARAMRPWSLWNGLTLNMIVRPERLAVLAFVWMGVFTLLAAGVRAGLLAVQLALHRQGQSLMVAGANPPGAPAFSALSVTVARLKIEMASWAMPYFHIDGTAGHGAATEFAMLAVVVWLACPAAMALMPFSLRRARVRPRHVVRIVWYWAVWLPVVAFIPSLVEAIQSILSLWSHNLLIASTVRPLSPGEQALRDLLIWLTGRANLLAVAVMALVAGWFWYHAVRGYLRIPRPFTVTAGMIIVVLLLSAALGFFVLRADNLVTQIFYEAIGK